MIILLLTCLNLADGKSFGWSSRSAAAAWQWSLNYEKKVPPPGGSEAERIRKWKSCAPDCSGHGQPACLIFPHLHSCPSVRHRTNRRSIDWLLFQQQTNEVGAAATAAAAANDDERVRTSKLIVVTWRNAIRKYMLNVRGCVNIPSNRARRAFGVCVCVRGNIHTNRAFWMRMYARNDTFAGDLFTSIAAGTLDTISFHFVAVHARVCRCVCRQHRETGFM